MQALLAMSTCNEILPLNGVQRRNYSLSHSGFLLSIQREGPFWSCIYSENSLELIELSLNVMIYVSDGQSQRESLW